MNYGKSPKVLGQFELNPPKYGFSLMHYQYLPILMLDSEYKGFKLPENLIEFKVLIDKVTEDLIEHTGSTITDKTFPYKYMYLTVKRSWVEPGNPGNRPGWHADGFGSSSADPNGIGDLNYIWSDMNPTEFAVQEFVNVPTGDFEMLESIERQVIPEMITSLPDNTLARLDEEVIHRVGLNVNPGVRTFFKLSASNHKFNLIGNTYNFDLPHDWEMYSRATHRNVDNSDFKID